MSFEFKQPISKEIFFRKYALHGEKTVEEVLEGVAEEIASVEPTEELRKIWKGFFYQAMISGGFIPAGRILANARLNSPMKNYNNCFTIDLKDSMKGIFIPLQEDALIGQVGGGVGFNISKLRPKGSKISRGGESSGVMSFLEIFDTSAKSISTGGGRRAAHLSILNIDHPDIEEFIEYKKGRENNKLTQFNISVGITDRFMKAVENDEDWNLVFPLMKNENENDLNTFALWEPNTFDLDYCKEQGYRVKDFNGISHILMKVYKTVKARELYDKMTKQAWWYNEPGALFLDTVENENNAPHKFKLDRVNPCFTGDTIVAVANGKNGVSIKELAESGNHFPVYSAKFIRGKWKTEIKDSFAFKTGTRQVVEVKLSNGTSFRCTPDHRLARKDGTYVEAKDSKDCYLEKFFTFSDKNTRKSYRHINSVTNGYSRQYRKIWEFYNGKYEKGYNIDHLDSDSTNDFIDNLILLTEEEHKNKTKDYWKEGNNPINQIEKERLSILQRQKNVLANASKYRWSEERKNLELSKLPPKPEKKDKNIILNDEVYVSDIIYLEDEDVYDLTVEDNHNFYIITKTDDDRFLNSSGILVHNCGEIVMPAYSLCCLSAINLSKLVKNQFTEDAEFNWEEFKGLIKLGVRFLDNVLDATDYPLEKIEEISKAWRRIGLGITGLGDALMKMNIRYGSKESIEFTSLIGYHLANEAYKASTELAIEKGKFPAFDDKIGDYGFIKKLDKDVRIKIREHGLRNIALLTTAPTGTTSLSLGNNCSSGIEPIFALQYDRTVRQENDSLKTETVYDDGWLEYLDFAKQNNFTIDHNDLPESIITSHDVSIKEGIDVQAALQYWIDHSISKTINMPFETTLDEYKDTFMYAWKQGLKGVTSFHEGAAMDGILSTKKEDKKDDFWKQIEVLPNSKRRPESLPCDIYEMQVNKQRMIVLVGKDIETNRPYEVFLTADQDNLIDLGRAKEGEIHKTKSGKYDLIIKGKRSTIVLEDISSIFDDDYAVMCRQLSLQMRHHIPLQFSVDQLNKTKRFDTFSKTMARVLKRYIEDGEKVISKSHSICPECSGELHFIEGCKTCPACGWSKC